jgi:hypothetical protein
MECRPLRKVPGVQRNRQLLTKNPPDRAGDEDQAAAECREEFHAATGWEALHCATTSRAQPSHWPHWVATPSSNCTSSKVMPARTWRAISRSDTRRHTQTIMAVRRQLAGCLRRPDYKYEFLAFAITIAASRPKPRPRVTPRTTAAGCDSGLSGRPSPPTRRAGRAA